MLHELSLVEVRNKIAKGEVLVEDVALACLEQIKKTESGINALLAMKSEEEILAEAREMDKKRLTMDVLPPLFGVVLTLKDVLCTKDLTTTAGSKFLEDFKPFYDATVVEKLREAGALIIAKNNMDEFAMGSSTENSAFKRTSNPHNKDCIPGGSSGGSAASVSAMQCFGSLGTDTGGSIRQPAALCGCVGLKPTYGRVSRYGSIAYASSLDQIGPLTRTVEDSALLLSVIAGHDPKDSTSAKEDVPNYMEALKAERLDGKIIGIPKEFFSEDMDPKIVQACKEMMKKAEELGAELVDVSIPLATKHAIAAYYVIATAEASSNLARYDGVRYGKRSADSENLLDLYMNSRNEGFGEEVKRRILVGTFVLSSGYYDAYYKKAAQVRTLIREDFERVLSCCDAILAPVSPVTAWNLGSKIDDPLTMYLMDIFTVSLNLAGLPGLAIPCGMVDNMPVGMQLIGSPFDEANILSIGNCLTK